MGKVEWGMGNEARGGLTLAEVLVSMGILVIGLLGVAALFPVGGHYMQTGDVADQAGAIAQAALDDAIVRGHLDPENWVVHSTLTETGAPFPCKFAQLLTGEGFGVPHRGIANTLGESVEFRSQTHGAAFVIDPLGLAAALDGVASNVLTNPALSSPARHFPAVNPGVAFVSPSWSPWIAPSSWWPVRRVTTVHEVSLATRSLNMSGAPPAAFAWALPPAEEAFTANDDLALILPDNGDDPSRGRWATWNNGSAPQPLPSSRRERGDYSWLISVSPGSSVARDALATSPDAYPYDVSVVVFHKRVLGTGQTDNGPLGGLLEAERLVNAKVVSTGTAGGELLLERRPSPSQDPVDESPFEDLRTGEYVMLTGPHPLSTPQRPMLFLQWYRVLTIEDSGDPILDRSGNEQDLDGDGPNARVLVSLRGPDWPWQPTDDLSQTNLLPNDLRVAILPGAVAVHTKTMRLESGTPWSVE